MAMTATYTNFAGSLVHESRGGAERFYSPDPLGSTSALLDASGVVTDTVSYWPYGEVRSRTGSSPTKFLFVGTLGYFADALTRLYVRARHYLATTARWMTVDPLWPEESAYGYCFARPVTCTDKSGLKPYGECIKDVLISAGIGCLAGLVISAGCTACLAGGIAVCGWFPPSCAALYELCSLVCGAGLVKCIVGALVTVLKSLIECLKPDPTTEPGSLEDCLEKCRIFPKGRAHMECMRNCRAPRPAAEQMLAGSARPCRGRA